MVRSNTAITPPKVIKRDDDIPWEEYHDDDEDPQLIPDVEDAVDATGKLIYCSQSIIQNNQL